MQLPPPATPLEPPMITSHHKTAVYYEQDVVSYFWAGFNSIFFTHSSYFADKSIHYTSTTILIFCFSICISYCLERHTCWVEQNDKKLTLVACCATFGTLSRPQISFKSSSLPLPPPVMTNFCNYHTSSLLPSGGLFAVGGRTLSAEFWLGSPDV